MDVTDKESIQSVTEQGPSYTLLPELGHIVIDGGYLATNL